MTSGGTVAVTGAAGEIGTAFRPFLARLFTRVRLLDQTPLNALASHESSTIGDARDEKVLEEVFSGADAIIDLVGCRSTSTWAELFEVNVESLRTRLAAAERAGVKRIAVASSMHVMGLYRRDQRVLPTMLARPDSSYAESKLLGEQACRWHATRTGARVVSLRIGCHKQTRDESEPCAWIGPEDIARLAQHVLVGRRAAPEIVHAVAPHRGDDCGQRMLRWRHGFHFLHRGESRQQSLARLPWWYPTDQVAREFRGGEFASRTLAR